MSKTRRITLNWQKLFAFEQVEAQCRLSEDRRIAGRLGEKIGGAKGCEVPDVQ